MFEGLAEAAAALSQTMNPPQVERVVEALVPAIVLKPAAAGTHRLGGTRLGGAPDAPAGFEWPRPPAPDDPGEIANRGASDARGEMLAHMARNLPYAFVAQIDLAEASRLGHAAQALPVEGRLLFFYDHAIGPWDTGTRAARVIWDASPATRLAPLAVPGDLAQAARDEAEAMAAIRAEFGRGEDGASEAGTIYGAPKRAVALTATWRMPHTASVEIGRFPEFRTGAADGATDPKAEAFREAYAEALEEHRDGYADEGWRRQQLLGSPQPEQDDPRFDAAVVSQFGRQHLSREEWRANRPRIEAEAANWRLLLQLDVADWMQAPLVEGTVFFLIRRDDLERRRFDKVMAVYQQT